MGNRRGVFRVLVGKPEGKRPLGKHMRRWEDNIKIDLQEVGCGGMDWIELAEDRERWQAFVIAPIFSSVPRLHFQISMLLPRGHKNTHKIFKRKKRTDTDTI
jgi:hypothetical protein